MKFDWVIRQVVILFTIERWVPNLNPQVLGSMIGLHQIFSLRDLFGAEFGVISRPMVDFHFFILKF